MFENFFMGSFYMAIWLIVIGSAVGTLAWHGTKALFRKRG